jgi:hypothetical protein
MGTDRQTDRQTYITKLIVAFRNLAKAPENSVTKSKPKNHITSTKINQLRTWLFFDVTRRMLSVVIDVSAKHRFHLQAARSREAFFLKSLIFEDAIDKSPETSVISHQTRQLDISIERRSKRFVQLGEFCTEMKAYYARNYRDNVSGLCGQHVEFLNVTTGGTLTEEPNFKRLRSCGTS